MTLHRPLKKELERTKYLLLQWIFVVRVYGGKCSSFLRFMFDPSNFFIGTIVTLLFIYLENCYLPNSFIATIVCFSSLSNLFIWTNFTLQFFLFGPLLLSSLLGPLSNVTLQFIYLHQFYSPIYLLGTILLTNLFI
jgi:hypothetical protein